MIDACFVGPTQSNAKPGAVPSCLAYPIDHVLQRSFSMHHVGITVILPLILAGFGFRIRVCGALQKVTTLLAGHNVAGQWSSDGAGLLFPVW